MRKRITTKEIAEMLGLARSTVIRALNNDPKIKQETIERVHTLANELGYQKNSIARSLASGRTNIIGCIMPNVIDPFFGETEFYRAVGRTDSTGTVRLGGANAGTRHLIFVRPPEDRNGLAAHRGPWTPGDVTIRLEPRR